MFSSKAFISAVIGTIIIFPNISKSLAAVTTLKATGEVISIADGDTVTLKKIKGDASLPEKMKIRFLGIDTPESHLSVAGQSKPVSQGHWADDAADAMAKLIPVGTQVSVISYGTDNHGRVLGRIFVGSLDVNKHMVEKGFAAPYLICAAGDDCTSDYFKITGGLENLSLCERAREKGVGIFTPGDELPELPFMFRLRMQKRKADKFVGDAKSKKLYAPADYAKVDTCNRVFFWKEEEAKSAGFKK